jgi:hypothetical protein
MTDQTKEPGETDIDEGFIDPLKSQLLLVKK